MKVKYEPSYEPLRNKHHGYTFIPSNYGNPAMSGQKNDRARYLLQHFRMQCNQKAVTQWRNMSAATKNAWSVFASTYPQPSKKDPNVFLSGYQLFIKRNTYEFLHEGINSAFILEPELSELPNPDFTAEINDNGMCLDVTEWYLKNFGILPEIGQFVICRIVPMAVNSGQFFAPLVATLEVDEVFIDGLFLSLFFNGHAPGVVFSVYLSKPVHAGRTYPSTKFRYMGCFKPTQFIQLTDTPDDYTGQAGKFVAVKATEDGVEFVDAGGGGLTCDDLADCALIELIQSQIDILGEIATGTGIASVPEIHLGFLYNFKANTDAANIANVGWHMPSRTEWLTLLAHFASSTAAGTAMKQTGTTYWVSDLGQTNAAKFNGRGSGKRGYPVGTFSSIYSATYFGSSTVGPSITCYSARLNDSGNTFTISSYSYKVDGNPIRLIKDATTLSDGESGTYFGNDGKIYRTICIGGQEWTADNLAETLMRDGTPIPEITDNAAWIAASGPARCAYNNDSANV